MFDELFRNSVVRTTFDIPARKLRIVILTRGCIAQKDGESFKDFLKRIVRLKKFRSIRVKKRG